MARNVLWSKSSLSLLTAASLAISGCTTNPLATQTGYSLTPFGGNGRYSYNRTPFLNVAPNGNTIPTSVAQMPSRNEAANVAARPVVGAAPAPPVQRRMRTVPAPSGGSSFITSSYGFDGALTNAGTPIDLGTAVPNSLFGLIRSAIAARPLRLPSCLKDEARPVPISTLATALGKNLPVRDYIPGFYGAPWVAKVGHSLLAILNAYAPKDPTEPIPKPDIRVYRDWFARKSGRASFVRQGNAIVFRGDRAVLYRVYVGGLVQCLDIVAPRGSAKAAGYVYYQHDGRMYETTTEFGIAR